MLKKSLFAVFFTVLLVSCFTVFAQELPSEAKNAGFVSGKDKKLTGFKADTLSGDKISKEIFDDSAAIIHVFLASKDTNGNGLKTAAQLAKLYPNKVYVVSTSTSRKLQEDVEKAGFPLAQAVPNAQSFISALGSPASSSWVFVRDGVIIATKDGKTKNTDTVQAVSKLFAAYPSVAKKSVASEKPTVTKIVITQNSSAKKTAKDQKSAAEKTPAIENRRRITPVLTEKPNILRDKQLKKEDLQIREDILQRNTEQNTESSAASQNNASQTAETEISILLNTGVTDASFASELELEVYRELNIARTQPAVYAGYLREYASHIEGMYYDEPGQPLIRLNEGLPAVTEAIEALESMTPVCELALSRGLSMASRDHVNDMGPVGARGHTGTDGSTMDTRIERHGTWSGRIAENIQYGMQTARRIVISLLVDDGVESRGHRTNVLHPDHKVVGISCGPHASYGTMCVQDFAKGFTEGNR